MFRRNEQHRQKSFFDGEHLLPQRLRQRLRGSWAGTFYRQVFCRIDEESFAVLYSEKASRPNVPVNVLVGAEILKTGFGWSDEQLYEQVCFNLQVRHALGLDDLRAELFDLRTVYNFRRRVREYAEGRGVNLFGAVFEQVTDEQLEAITIETGWQRMDSTQVLSNLAQMTRLELIVSVVQVACRQLDDGAQAPWREGLAPYLKGRPQQVCYRIKGDEVDTHLERLGQILVELAAGLRLQTPASDAAALVERILKEQYDLQDDGTLALRSVEAVSAGSLQSPHDPHATYRVKGGTAYRGGYVINVSETCDPDNPLQLVTDVEVAPNQTDDSHLLERSLDRQGERGICVEKVTVDGGYTGPTAERAAERHRVDLRATRVRGRGSAPHRLGWETYSWMIGRDRQPLRVGCPKGQIATLEPGGTKGRFIARFDHAACAACPLFKHGCRVHPRRAGPTLYVRRRTIEVAWRRQQLCPQDTPIRAVIEATIRSLKRPFRAGKLPVRGLTRAKMVVYGSALMVNLRRLHRHVAAQRQQKRTGLLPWETAPLPSSLLDGVHALCAHLRHLYLRVSPFTCFRHATIVA